MAFHEGDCLPYGTPRRLFFPGGNYYFLIKSLTVIPDGIIGSTCSW